MKSVVDQRPAEVEEVSIKLHLHRSNGQVAKHRVRGQFDWAAVSTFILHIWSGSHIGKPIVVEYTDDEGDVVCVGSQAEWAECLRVYQQMLPSLGGRPLCLTVRRRQCNDDDEWSDEDYDNDGSRLAPRDTVTHFRETTSVAPPSTTAVSKRSLPRTPDMEEDDKEVTEIPHPTAAEEPPKEEEVVHVDLPVLETVTSQPPVPTPALAPAPVLAPLSPRSEATVKLQAIFPDVGVEEAHFLLHLHGNNLQTVIAFKLGA